MFIAGIGNPKRKPTEKDAATHLILKNYEASISQFIDWNDDPFGQDVDHVLMDNILKFGDDPTVNQRDRALTTPELWGPYLTVRWLEWWSVRSRCRACSDGQHTQKWWWSNGEPRRSKTIQIRERERERERGESEREFQPFKSLQSSINTKRKTTQPEDRKSVV